jgi:hypothetical protein
VSEVAVLVGAMLSPLLALGLLLWLTHLEETLPQAVYAARRKPPPPPILAVPLAELSERGSPPADSPSDNSVRQAFSRSVTLSLGGSTNR